MSKGPTVWMTVYMDADHAHDLVTRRSITGKFMMLKDKRCNGTIYLVLFVNSIPFFKLLLSRMSKIC
jgi:hypothetical protein